MNHFSEEFKNSLIQKSLLPNGPSLASLAKEHNIAVTTLYGWKKKYANTYGMKKSSKWTAEKKLEVIIQSASLTENELGEFLRKNGLHSSDLEQWKEESLAALRGPGRPKKDPELAQSQSREKQLQKDLRRKEKALAEMSARVVLLKKSHEIFGGGEEDE